jgi:hypothetical protein
MNKALDGSPYMHQNAPPQRNLITSGFSCASFMCIKAIIPFDQEAFLAELAASYGEAPHITERHKTSNIKVQIPCGRLVLAMQSF